MRERLAGLLGNSASELEVSTFHSAAARILRREAEAVGLSRSFVIYDDADQLQLVKRAVRESGVEPILQPREILHRIDQQKNAGPAAARRGRPARRPARAGRAEGLRRLPAAAPRGERGRLRRPAAAARRAVPHQRGDPEEVPDPLHRTCWSTSSRTPTRCSTSCSSCSRRRRRRTWWWSATTTSRIYRWRGAEVDNILGFPTEYAGAKVVKLEQNYRSDQTILDAADAVISENPRRMGKKLFTDPRPGRDAPAADRARRARRGGAGGEQGARAAPRGLHPRLAGRDLLPDERAEPRARRGAPALAGRLHARLRPQLLRARRGEGRAPPTCG